jgi:DNA-binding response OmpR family regulator
MKKILIVEDDQPLALAYQKKFSQAGFEVDRAEDGRAGVSKAIQFRPDIIILDIMLPGGMNGFDVLQQLKLSKETKDIPVIVMTNLAEEGESALNMGAVEYLLKVNISLKDLVEKVKHHLK